MADAKIQFALGKTTTRAHDDAVTEGQTSNVAATNDLAADSQRKAAETVRSTANKAFEDILTRDQPLEGVRAVRPAEAEDFFASYHRLVFEGRRRHFEPCTRFLIAAIVPSGVRAEAFDEYIGRLSTTWSYGEHYNALSQLSDALHAHKFHGSEPQLHAAVIGSAIENLAISQFSRCSDVARSLDDDKQRSNADAQLQRLLAYWTQMQYLPDQTLRRLDEVLSRPQPPDPGSGLYANWTLPAYHGDRTSAWQDLPAACMLSLIKRNSKRPINPRLMRPIRLDPGKPPAHLEAAMRQYLTDVNRLSSASWESPDGTNEARVDRLGQNYFYDSNGDLINSVANHWGWSRDFCDEMLNRKRRQRSLDRRSSSRSSMDSQNSSRADSRSPDGKQFARSRQDRQPQPLHTMSSSPRRSSRSHFPRPEHEDMRVTSRTGDNVHASQQQGSREQSLSGQPQMPYLPGPDGQPLFPPRPPNWQGPWPPGVPPPPLLPFGQLPVLPFPLLPTNMPFPHPPSLNPPFPTHFDGSGPDLSSAHQGPSFHPRNGVPYNRHRRD